MGEMADFALEGAAEQESHYYRHQDAPLQVQYDEGLIDEHGASLQWPGQAYDRAPAWVQKLGRVRK
jgi:hypothetical protein